MRTLYLFLVLAPIAVVAEHMHASPLVVFTLSALAIVPLSGLLGSATEQLAGHTGPAIGGLLNATLGNLAELIIAGLALRAGLIDLVKASITGSILGNLLLVLGAAQLAGGLKHREQKFNANFAGMSVSLLTIAVTGLAIPSIFRWLHPDPARDVGVQVSEWIAGLLIVGYVLSLVYSMGTHRAVFGEGGDVATGDETPHWSLGKSIGVLAGTAAALGWLSELLVGSTVEAVARMGLSETFVGLILVPIIGNAAEHSSAVMMAMKNRMDLSVSIALGSSIQVALLIAPLLVFAGALFGQPMDLAFHTLELASLALAVGVASAVIRDAESNWLEGAFLLIAYAMIAVAFWFF